MNTEGLKASLVETYQIDFDISGDGSEKIFIRPSEMAVNHGFSIVIELGWKRLDAKVDFEDFSKPFIRKISNPSNNKIEGFLTIINRLESRGFESSVIVNDQTSTDIREVMGTDLKWSNFEIDTSLKYIENENDYEKIVNLLAEDMVGLMLILVDLESDEDTLPEQLSKGMPEGALTKRYVNKYERSRINRKICLSKHGYNCMVCDFNFEESFGDTGRNYIHVHHATPVSKIGPDYDINPTTELIPVCPNCHSMLHKKDPPYTVDELKSIRINDN